MLKILKLLFNYKSIWLKLNAIGFGFHFSISLFITIPLLIIHHMSLLALILIYINISMYFELESYTYRPFNVTYPYIGFTVCNHTLIKYLNCNFVTTREKINTCNILLNDRILFPYQRKRISQMLFELNNEVEFIKLKSI